MFTRLLATVWGLSTLAFLAVVLTAPSLLEMVLPERGTLAVVTVVVLSVFSVILVPALFLYRWHYFHPQAKIMIPALSLCGVVILYLSNPANRMEFGNDIAFSVGVILFCAYLGSAAGFALWLGRHYRSKHQTV
jgi:hypothetical protein